MREQIASVVQRLETGRALGLEPTILVLAGMLCVVGLKIAKARWAERSRAASLTLQAHILAEFRSDLPLGRRTVYEQLREKGIVGSDDLLFVYRALRELKSQGLIETMTPRPEAELEYRRVATG